MELRFNATENKIKQYFCEEDYPFNCFRISNIFGCDLNESIWNFLLQILII